MFGHFLGRMSCENPRGKKRNRLRMAMKRYFCGGMKEINQDSSRASFSPFLADYKISQVSRHVNLLLSVHSSCFLILKVFGTIVDVKLLLLIVNYLILKSSKITFLLSVSFLTLKISLFPYPKEKEITCSFLIFFNLKCHQSSKSQQQENYFAREKSCKKSGHMKKAYTSPDKWWRILPRGMILYSDHREQKRGTRRDKRNVFALIFLAKHNFFICDECFLQRKKTDTLVIQSESQLEKWKLGAHKAWELGSSDEKRMCYI